MDPFSLTVSALTVAQIAGSLVTVGNSYCRSCRSQSEEIQRLVREIGLLSGVLNSISTAVDSAGAAPPHLLEGPLEVCKTELLDLHEFLLKQLNGKNRFLRLGRRMTWPMREQETKEWIDRIERSKKTFMLALQADERCVFFIFVLFYFMFWLGANRLARRGMSGRICSDLAEMKRSQEQERQEAREAKKRMFFMLRRDSNPLANIPQGQKYRDVKTWLSPSSPQDCHMAARKQRQQDTGRAILQDQTYQHWKSQSGGFLWLYGCRK
jgi:hypothetical protein